jgi:molybdopterin molybdotransferase
MPPFRQSAMDGYALSLHDSNNYILIDEVKAGDSHQPILKKGDAIRIFTGAPVPETANAVIMQERVSLNDKRISIEGLVKEKDNIRPLGEQVKKGEIALKKNTKLSPAAVGYLYSLGITNVSVFKKPSIALITTGNELIEPGQSLGPGKIYESNSGMIQSALEKLGVHNIQVYKIKDNYTTTLETLKKAINTNDLVIITGGISVGDYDFVGRALHELQVDEIFYKVKQKPGKPLFFGKKEDSLIFALPGNPAAALSCFYVYVYTALQIIENNPSISLPRISAKSQTTFSKKGDRSQFLKAIYYQGNVTILEGQSSAMLQTFALSNALVYLPSNHSEIKLNEEVEVILLPF